MDRRAQDPRSPRRPAAAGRRGSVLVVLLITILFAALLLTRLVEASSADLLVAMREADRHRLRADAHAALETTLAVLADFRAIDRGLYSPAQGWGDPLTHAEYVPREGVTVTVTFEDESGKLSLPSARVEMMSALLVQLGLTTDDAARVTDALLAWMRQNHTAVESAASASSYEMSQPAAQPPFRSLRSFHELASINVVRDFFYDADGRPTPLWHDFAANVSLYQFAGTNLNAAKPAVLMAANWDESQVESLDKYLTTVERTAKTPPYFRSGREVFQQLGRVALAGFGTQTTCLRVIVTVEEGAARLQLSALVSPGGQARMPQPVAADPANPANTGRLSATTNRLSRGAAATVGLAGNNARGRAGGGATGPAGGGQTNSLQYPFAVLELAESTLPPVPPPTI